MGGIGSGHWPRWSTKTTTEEVKRIDIRYLKKRGLLKLYTTSALSWSRNGEPSGDIRYTCFHDRVVLNYRHRINGEDWNPVEQTILFEFTACHFGGHRFWFLCPNCSKRVGILYGLEKLFLCRHCYRIPYASQQQGEISRLIEQKHKLGERIFEHYEYGEGWGKKKGMHWKTFNSLHDCYERLDRLCDLKIMALSLSR